MGLLFSASCHDSLLECHSCLDDVAVVVLNGNDALVLGERSVEDVIARSKTGEELYSTKSKIGDRAL